MLTTFFGLWALFLTFPAQATSQSTRRPSRPAHGIDIHNGTALREYTTSLRRLLGQSGGGRSLPGMSPNNLAGRIRNPFEGIVGLEPRQTCTDGADNHCFPNPDSFCSNCGVCCTQTAGAWCCVVQTAICCPADTALPNGQQGCCEDWQTCDSTTGCTDPTTTISTTITDWATVYGTSTSYTTRSLTTTIFTTEITFVTRTASNVDTATHVSYTTATPGAKVHRRSVEYNPSLPTAIQGGHIVMGEGKVLYSPTDTNLEAPAPTIAVYAHSKFDGIAHRLQNMGVIVKRQSTITEISTFTVTATTEITSVVTSTISSVSSIVSTIHSTITVTTFENAATTVEITSTITAAPNRDTTGSELGPSSSAGVGGSNNDGAAGSNSNTQTNGSPSSNGGEGGGLTKAEQAGIGVGSAGGAVILCALLIFLWRRHKKNKENKASIGPDSPSVGAVVGGASSEKASYYVNGPHQRDSRLSANTNTNTNSMSTHSYQAVPIAHPSEVGMTAGRGSPGRPAEMPDNRGFGYAPYELYEETYDQPQELYSRNHHDAFGLHEVR